MKKSRTGSAAGEALASPSVATVQVPLPLLDVLADTRTAFFGLCLAAGEQVLRTMMEHDRERLCGARNVPNPDRRAYRHGQTPGEVTLGGRRILVPRLRARSVDGHELDLPSFAYAAHRDPLDARTLEAIAIGVTTRKYRRALDPLPAGRGERAVSKSSVSRRFVALTSAQLATWLARPLDDLAVRVFIIDGLHSRDHVVVLAPGVGSQGQKHVLALCAATTENATVGKAIREASGTTAIVQRCEVHKRRNVLEHLPRRCARASAACSTRRTGHRGRRRQAPGPAARGRARVGVVEPGRVPPRRLGRNSPLQRLVRHVRRWRNGRMFVRWIAAGLRDATRSFRRLRGHRDLAALVRALDRATVDGRQEVT